MVRAFTGCAVVAVVVALAAVQWISSVTLHAVAQPGAWSARISPHFALAVNEDSVDVPLPPAVRLVLARRAFAGGATGLAAKQLARLSPSADRAVLEAELAERRGDVAAAVRGYLLAGDRDALQRRIALLESGGDTARALALEERVVLRLERDRAQQDALAESYFELGRLRQAQAYRFAVGAPQRRTFADRASDAYAAAVRLAPYRERYLLGFAYQQLNVDRNRAAVDAFERARRVDPAIADPLVGLADAALRRGDLVAMRAFVARARQLDPASPALRRLLAKGRS